MRRQMVGHLQHLQSILMLFIKMEMNSMLFHPEVMITRRAGKNSAKHTDRFMENKGIELNKDILKMLLLIKITEVS